MKTVADRQSAKILPFPVRQRTVAQNLSAKAKFAAEIASLRALHIASESSWYHEEAIRDAARDRKN